MQTGPSAARERPILVVEDDEDTVAALRLLLADEGYVSIAASDARRAIDELVRADPGLILLDWSLDDGSGEAVLSAARSGAAGRTAVVLMTGASSLCARSRTADAVLRKPFDVGELLKMVARFYRP
jgi:DNA-binding response OmpR family regulator